MHRFCIVLSSFVYLRNTISNVMPLHIQSFFLASNRSKNAINLFSQCYKFISRKHVFNDIINIGVYIKHSLWLSVHHLSAHISSDIKCSMSILKFYYNIYYWMNQHQHQRHHSKLCGNECGLTMRILYFKFFIILTIQMIQRHNLRNMRNWF